MANAKKNGTKDRARVAHLRGRQSTLEKELSAAAKKDGELAALVEERQANLAEGQGTAGDVEKLAGRLDTLRSSVARLETALVTVRAALGEVEQRIAMAAHEREREEQNVASEALRRKAETLLDEFILFAVHPGEPLALRALLAQELMEKFPLARPIGPVSVDELANAFKQKLRLDPERTRHWGVVERVKRLLIGLGDSYLTPAEAKSLHVRL